MTKVLIVDQFSNISPYSLQKNPTSFDALCERVVTDHATSIQFPFLRKPEVRDVEEGFIPEMCTTVIRANAEGIAEAWRWRWDSSG